jgi:hypothetical protein
MKKGRKGEREGERKGGKAYLQLALAEDDKDRVDQLRDLGKDKQHHPQAGSPLSIALSGRGTHGVTEGQGGDVVQKMRDRAQHPAEGEEGEAKVPVGQRATPVELLSGGRGGEGGREGGREGVKTVRSSISAYSEHHASYTKGGSGG